MSLTKGIRTLENTNTYSTIPEPSTIHVDTGIMSVHQLPRDIYTKIVESLRSTHFASSQLLALRGSDAQKALDVMHKLYNDDDVWRTFESDNPGSSRQQLLSLMVKVAVESNECPPTLSLESVKLNENTSAQGSFGEVYMGSWNGKQVAVKKIRVYSKMSQDSFDEIRSDICREVSIQCNLKHPNILEIYGIYEDAQDRNRLGLVLPWEPNGTLFAYLQNITTETEPSEEQRMTWLRGISQGICYLHAAGLAHGDIKNDNVLMGSDGHLKICDFGIATFPSANSGYFKSKRGGNEQWTAPEYLWASSNLLRRPTFAGDVYSFTMMCITVFSGPFPWGLKPKGALSVFIVHGGRPQIPGNFPQYLAAQLPTWWHNEPSQRPQMKTIVEFLQDPTAYVMSPTQVASINVTSTIARSPPSEALTSFLPLLFCDYSVDNTLEVHILFDEKAFIKGLYKACNHNLKRVDEFRYSTLQTILERGRRIASRSLFLTFPDTPSHSSHPLSSLGYTLIPGDKSKGTTPLCIQEIQKIVASTKRPGILVLLSGSEGDWMDHGEFVSTIEYAHGNRWIIEVLAWNNSTDLTDRWKVDVSGATTRRSGCVTFLENFYVHLFST